MPFNAKYLSIFLYPRLSRVLALACLLKCSSFKHPSSNHTLKDELIPRGSIMGVAMVGKLRPQLFWYDWIGLLFHGEIGTLLIKYQTICSDMCDQTHFVRFLGLTLRF